MRLHALDRKLLRDLVRLRSQGVAIALVLACGVAIFLTGYSMTRALEATRADYYGRQHFADIFASARRAPLSVADEARQIEGVSGVEARVAGWVVLDLLGRNAPAAGRVLSLPPEGPRLNVPILVAGRLPEPDSDSEVAVTARFAAANGYRPGDSFAAIADGQRLDLTITGTLRSPEYVYALPPGGMFPDDAGFGIIWMPERAAAATFGLSGAFNDLALTLRRDADVAAVTDRVDALLEPWGGTGAHGRGEQISHAFLDAEIMQLRSMSAVLPPIFFGIAAFLVNMVLGRIVALERSEIGLLKAIGYRNGEIAIHYLLLAALIAVIGILLGWVAGAWLGHGMATLYARFYDFPWLVRHEGLDVYAISGLIGLLAAGIGAARAALSAARLSPAVAMAPPVPPRFRRGPLDRLAVALGVSQPGMMVLRGLLRWPVRSGMTALALAFGVSMLVASNFMTDSVERMIALAFSQSNRQDVILVLTGDAPVSVVDDARQLPGVMAAEGERSLAVTLRNGHLTKRVGITARTPDADLARTLDDRGHVLPLPESGLLLSRQLADQLDLQPGDLAEVTVTGDRQERFEVPVSALATQFIGIGAYMELDALSERLREAPRVSAVNLLVDSDRLTELRASLKEVPALASAVMLSDMQEGFSRTIDENISRSVVVFLGIALLITAGVAYNGARIQLSERARELASLRVLGFTRTEVSSILLSETAVLALLAQPLGWILGGLFAWSMTAGFESDLYRIPLVLTAANFASASLVSLAATAVAALFVRRRLDKADLIAVLKTRE